jgi:very-short-patch-repair endonuclease
VGRGADREQRSSRDEQIAETAKVPAQREETRFRRDERAERNDIPATTLVAGLATRQKGPITHRQLLAAGLRHSAIGRRAEAGALHRVFHGVYLVGHEALAPLARESAALLAVGDGAILSHESAALAWGILDDYSADVHVTVVARKLRSRAGLRIHRASTRPPTRRRHGLLVTSPAQTLLDLAAADSPHLEHAFIEAHGRRLVSAPELATAIEQAGSRRGVRALRALIAANQTGFTKSKAEKKLRALLRAAGLPEPRTNVTLLGHMVDCLWPEQRLVVEFDGHGFHGHRRAFETDRRRDATLVANGYRVMRITWLQLTQEPYAVLANVASALARPNPH